MGADLGKPQRCSERITRPAAKRRFISTPPSQPRGGKHARHSGSWGSARSARRCRRPNRVSRMENTAGMWTRRTGARGRKFLPPCRDAQAAEVNGETPLKWLSFSRDRAICDFDAVPIQMPQYIRSSRSRQWLNFCRWIVFAAKSPVHEQFLSMRHGPFLEVLRRHGPREVLNPLQRTKPAPSPRSGDKRPGPRSSPHPAPPPGAPSSFTIDPAK
jgi:hypothetical protein